MQNADEVVCCSRNVPLAQVNIGLLADQVGVTTTNTLDLGQGEHDLLLSIDVGVQQPQNVLEVALLPGDERYSQKGRRLALTVLDRENCCHMDFVHRLNEARLRTS